MELWGTAVGLLSLLAAVSSALDVYYWRRMKREQAARREMGRELAAERGSARFRIARMRVDIGQLQTRMRGEIHTGLWIEGSVADDVALLTVFSDGQLSESKANAVLAMLPKAERV